MADPRLSIVIPAFNEEKELPECLGSVQRAIDSLNCSGWVEVIVCDNNSTDSTARIARNMGARVVFEGVNQIGRARNAGAFVAQGEWLLFIDADSRLDPVNLGRVLKLGSPDGTAAGGGCTIALNDPPVVGYILTAMWNLVSSVTGWAAGSFIFCRRRAFEEVGGFSLDFYAAEELDLSRRLMAWAERRGLKWLILKGCPHVSSSRKLRLYRAGEVARWMVRGMWRGRKALMDRSNLDFFYDGRR